MVKKLSSRLARSLSVHCNYYTWLLDNIIAPSIEPSLIKSFPCCHRVPY